MFVGYGVTAPERGWDDFKGVDVSGKILVVLINDPDFEGGEGQFGGKAMTYYGRWTYKYEEAARRGAAGVMIVHETDPGLLRLGDGQEQQHQHHVRHRPQEPGDRAHRRSKAGSSATSRSRLFRAVGLGFRGGQGRRQAQGLPADRRSRRRSTRQRHREDRA